MWMNNVWYLGVYLVSSKALSCNYNLIDVVIELLVTKYMPIAIWLRCLSLVQLVPTVPVSLDFRTVLLCRVVKYL